MIVSCSKCGKRYDPLESDSNSICPICGGADEPTISDLGRPETPTDHSEPSATGVHGPASASAFGSAQTPAKSDWLGKEFGDYKIVGRLGKGGMGMVFLAIQRSTDREVALKVIRDDRLNDFDSTMAREWVARFKSEALAAARLEHENIVTVYEVGQLDGNHFFSMQYVRGKSLSQISKQRILSGKEVAQFMIPVCRALHHAHSRGILHRDIKPGNIMIDEQGRPFLTDFGLAKWFEDDDHSMTRSGQVVGTATYMSPQQATDASHATIACDVYSLGATIYRLLAGRPPFDQGSLVEVLRQVVQDEPAPPSNSNRAIDADIETIALKCLEKDPAARYATADALADDLQRYLNGEPIMARPVSKRERFWRWCKRNPVVAALAASAILLLLTTVVVSTVGYFNATKKNQEITAANEEITVANEEISKAYERITKEEEQTRRNLRTSLLAQAIGMQSSTVAGRRGRALKALSEAASIQPGLDVRNEYARYLDQPDIELLYDIPIDGWGMNGNPYADAIAGSNRIIAVADGWKPIEIDSATGEIVKVYDEMGPFERTSDNGSTFLAEVSHNGKFLAGNSKAGKAIEIWDLEKSEMIGVLKNENDLPIKLQCLVFDDDATSIYCAGQPDPNLASVEFYRYSLSDLELLSTWTQNASSVCSLQVIDGEFLLAGLGTEGTNVVIWQKTQGSGPPKQAPLHKVSKTLPNRNFSRTIAFDPTFRRIYVGQENGYFNAFDFPAMNPVSQALLGRHAKRVSAMNVSKNLRWLASCGGDRRLKIWDNLTGYAVTQIETDTIRGANLQWLPDGKNLLADSNTGLRIWNFLPPISKQFLISDAAGSPRFGFLPEAIKFSSTEDALFYSGGNCLSRLDLKKIENGFEFVTEVASVDNIFVSNSGDVYGPVSKFDTNPWNLFSGLPGKIVRTIEKSPNSQILDLAQLDNGMLVLSEFENFQSVRVTQLDSTKKSLNLDFPETGIGQAYPIVFVAGEARRIAVHYLDAEGSFRLMVLDLDTGEELFQTVTPFHGFAMDSKGSRVVFKRGTQLVVTDVDSKKELCSAEVGAADRFAISGTGKSIVSLDRNDGQIRIFDHLGALQFELVHDEVLPTWIALSQTGKWFALADLYGAVRIWDLDQVRTELRTGGVMSE